MVHNHNYKTSTDYERLFELANKEQVVCFIDYQFDDDCAPQKEIALTDNYGRLTISSLGVVYISAENKESFISKCISYNVEFIDHS